jgi:hypothetical protein
MSFDRVGADRLHGPQQALRVQAVDVPMKGGCIEQPISSRTRSRSLSTISGGAARHMFSSCRTQPTPYCGVTINRGWSERWAPPRCQSVPLVIASDPGMISVAPFNLAVSSIAQKVLTPSGGRGRGIFASLSSKCQGCCTVSPGCRQQAALVRLRLDERHRKRIRHESCKHRRFCQQRVGAVGLHAFKIVAALEFACQMRRQRSADFGDAILRQNTVQRSGSRDCRTLPATTRTNVLQARVPPAPPPWSPLGALSYCIVADIAVGLASVVAGKPAVSGGRAMAGTFAKEGPKPPPPRRLTC